MIRPLALSLALLTLAACGPSNEERVAAQRAEWAEKEAATRLANLKKMQEIGRDDLALNFANDILERYPNTKVAAEVRPLTEAMRAKVETQREEKRLRELWAYHTTDDVEAGGIVRSAYVFSANTFGAADAGKEAPRPRLVLRRHPQWGDDVYLHYDRGGFTCGSPCTVSVQFDDAPATTYPASLPESGEPAIFVEDFKAFVTALPEAKRVRITAAFKEGGEQTAEFEVGGYDTATIGSPLRPASIEAPKPEGG